jgi:hypothetical protein
LEKSSTIATHLTGKTFASLKIFKGKAAALEALAEYLLKPDSEMAVAKMVNDSGQRCPRPRGAGVTKRAGQDACVAIRSVA